MPHNTIIPILHWSLVLESNQLVTVLQTAMFPLHQPDNLNFYFKEQKTRQTFEVQRVSENPFYDTRIQPV